MQSFKYSILIMVSLLVLFSCETSKNPLLPENVTGPYYPLKVGNQWQYNRTISYYNVHMDSTFDSRSKLSSIVMQVIRTDTLYDSVKTFVLQETLNEEGATFYDYTWYANSDSGLYLYAYHNGGFLIPKVSQANKILFNGRYFNAFHEISRYLSKNIPNFTVMEDSLYYENPPILSLKYPLETGMQWMYRGYGQPVWRMDKKVIGQEEITVPAGKFNCFKVLWMYDTDYDGEWDDWISIVDYVCEKGLIIRRVDIKKVTVTGADGPDVIATTSMLEESVLTGLSIK